MQIDGGVLTWGEAGWLKRMTVLAEGLPCGEAAVAVSTVSTAIAVAPVLSVPPILVWDARTQTLRPRASRPIRIEAPRAPRAPPSPAVPPHGRITRLLITGWIDGRQARREDQGGREEHELGVTVVRGVGGTLRQAWAHGSVRRTEHNACTCASVHARMYARARV
eukprot:2269347-Pleurochrysis_carterae.AAC.1